MTKNAEYQAAYYQRHKYRLKKEIIALGEFKCALCGYNDRRALEIDHVNGGGSEHHRRIGGIGYFKQVLKMLKNKDARILCRNCNWIEYMKRSKRNSLLLENLN